ncbi:hypothetical protein Q9L58_008680 [Maublancomyces gigas]|uniref:Uncharacterized protein n=1 Tax=Discina gigas TaxID=1032678 RepID=A0ABR3G9N2_9PEZI
MSNLQAESIYKEKQWWHHLFCVPPLAETDSFAFYQDRDGQYKEYRTVIHAKAILNQSLVDGIEIEEYEPATTNFRSLEKTLKRNFSYNLPNIEKATTADYATPRGVISLGDLRHLSFKRGLGPMMLKDITRAEHVLFLKDGTLPIRVRLSQQASQQASQQIQADKQLWQTNVLSSPDRAQDVRNEWRGSSPKQKGPLPLQAISAQHAQDIPEGVHHFQQGRLEPQLDPSSYQHQLLISHHKDQQNSGGPQTNSYRHGDNRDESMMEHLPPAVTSFDRVRGEDQKQNPFNFHRFQDNLSGIYPPTGGHQVKFKVENDRDVNDPSDVQMGESRYVPPNYEKDGIEVLEEVIGMTKDAVEQLESCLQNMMLAAKKKDKVQLEKLREAITQENWARFGVATGRMEETDASSLGDWVSSRKQNRS